MEKKAWYLEPEEYKWLLEQANLSEKEYLSAMNAVIKIFPLDSSIDYTKGIMKREGGLSAPFYLHPVPFNVLKSHPVYTFMSGQVRDNNILAEIVNFGGDLEITADIPKIASVCKRLRNEKEYIGALFEIEILAALIRSGIQAEIIVTPDFRGRLRSGFLYLVFRPKQMIPIGQV